jgi:Ribbon-helix-helix protein, copG family
MAAAHPLSLRLGRDGIAELEEIARKRGVSRAEAARQAIAETAQRDRRYERATLREEALRLANDEADRREMAAIAADLDGLTPAWPDS